MSLACKDMEPIAVCFDDGAGTLTSLVVHYEYGNNAAGETIIAKTRYTDANGAIFDTSLGTVTVGACPAAAAGVNSDVEWKTLCDISPDDGSVIATFCRRVLTIFNADGTIASQVVDDFELDQTTAYTPIGTVGDCSDGCGDAVAAGVLLTWGSAS